MSNQDIIAMTDIMLTCSVLLGITASNVLILRIKFGPI